MKVHLECGKDIFIDDTMMVRMKTIYVYTDEKTVRDFKKIAPVFIDTGGLRYSIQSIERDPMGSYLGIYRGGEK